MPKSRSLGILLCRLSLLVALIAALFPLSARAQDKVELFGGFSYVRGEILSSPSPIPVPPCSPGTCPPPVTQHPNLFGWEFSGAYKFFPFLSANLDFGEQYGTLNGGGVHFKTILLGPQLSLPGPISPFVHAEFGFARETVGAYTNSAYVSRGNDTSFATALGGGLDVKALPFLGLRLIQFDYLRTSLYGRTQNQPRVSAGIIFRF